MKKDQIKLAGTYLAKVSNQLVPVRLDAVNPHGGWDGTNLATGKKVRIKSAQRLRGPYVDRTARASDPATPPADSIPQFVTATLPNRKPKRQTKLADKTHPAGKKLSGLDVACQLLAAKAEPMTCKELVDQMLSQGLWTTGGKTPAATINSAIQREIATKNDQSRFIKTERGKFTLRTN